MMGININDSTQDFTGQILRGEKTIETRPTRSLDPYIGKRVGIVRTGVGKATLVGYATVGEPVTYTSVAAFRRDYSKHRIAPGSAFDIKDRLRYGYPLMQVEAVTPKQVQSKGIVARKLNPAKRNPLHYPTEWFPYDGGIASSPVAKQIEAGKALWETPAFKKWFGDSKVRDLARRPMVVYHGTCSSGFTRFDPTKTREMGFHFGTFSQSKDFLKGCGEWRDERDPGIYPVYLSIQKPLFTPDVYSEDPVYFIEWLEKTNHIHDWFPDESDSYYQSLSKMREQLVEARMLPGREGYELMKPLFKKIWGFLRKIVMRKGYDGIRYKNENEGNTDDPYNIAWIAFSPAQVKSAIENRGTFNRRDPDLRNPYTQPDLRERLKKRIMAGDKGGLPGEWSARKAQLLAAEYEKAGGGYTGNRSASQRSLSRWTRQDWRTKSGKPSLETGERYLPAKAIEALSPAEYGATTRAKRRATGQFSRQPKRIAMKTSEYRNPMDPRSAKTQIATTVDTYRKAASMLGGKVLDYGAGLGLGTDALREEGLLADSFEPYPERWKGKRPPTYTDSADIPSGSYDGLVSFSVINVVEPDVRKFLFKEVARILQPDGTALITGRTRQDVGAAKIKTPHLEEGGYLIGEDQRYQKGFTQAELERYAKEVLGPGFTVEANRALNGASIKITKGKPNPAKRSTVRSKLSQIIEPGDRMVCYDTASGEDFYRLWDIVHTALPLTEEALTEIEGMLDDDGVLVIESGETPAGLQDHFRKATRYNGLLLVQGPKDPEGARIKTEELRRELE